MILNNIDYETASQQQWQALDQAVRALGRGLLVLGGEGRYQERNGEIRVLKKGDVVRIPLNVEHWHGAAPNSWFTHISVETNLPNNQTTWLEPVSDAEYK